ncbi:hypothetical protein M422DRAFT_244835 [Sphaerobolus stellatus SS14]|nr:hypothetical protein M422DRAFT_244835 [Sphaerobolus stellatus SS14]
MFLNTAGLSLAGSTPALHAFGRPLNPDIWNTVAGTVGCGKTANVAQLACMKTISFRTLENAAESGGKDFVPIPLLVGNTRQKGDIFVVAAEQLYLRTDIPGLIELGGDVVTKIVFSCPVGTTASDHVDVNVPVFRYRYNGIFPGISHQSDLREFHTAEIPIIFGTYSPSPFGPPTSAGIALSSYVQSAWVALLRIPLTDWSNTDGQNINPLPKALSCLGTPTIKLAVLWNMDKSQQNGTTVQTQQGQVSGTTVTTGVRQFLGIPYATAKRWQAPQAAPTRTSTLKATSFGASCPQSFTTNFNEFLLLSGAGLQTGLSQSETCQNLNIWAPTVDRKQGTAVMIWIYGGSFAYGSTNFPYYNAQNMVQANDDIIVVTINYRLNIFGQPNAPQLFGSSVSQNFGLLDQKAAIQWVHANIASFGGDPNRIILFGESAGSISIDAYTYANPTDTIVKGVIQESASLAGNSLLAPQGNVTTVVSWTEVAGSVGCTTLPTPFQFACMQLIPFEELEEVVITLDAAFAPVPDGITYFSDINARSAAGRFLKVPTLVGTNAQEGDVFVVALELLELGASIPGLTQEGSDDVTALMFNCPASITASDRVNAGVSTWRYRYEGTNSFK